MNSSYSFSLMSSQVYTEYSGSMRKCFVKNSKIAFENLKIILKNI